ncbi:MAG: 3D domain-containing protein [Clostridiales bacterium]|nr:3D domain-containing protein [Clostridiales bacterium]
MTKRVVVASVLAIFIATGCGVSEPIMDASGEIPETAEEVTIYEVESFSEAPKVEEPIESTEIKMDVLEDIEEVTETPHSDEELAVEPTEEIEEIEEVEEPQENKTFYGTCTITHYCNCSICCGQWAGGNTASGVPPQAGVTVACGDLPFGTEIEINGSCYIVQDRGVPGQWIDIYCGSHDEALQRGMYTADVYIIN